MGVVGVGVARVVVVVVVVVAARVVFYYACYGFSYNELLQLPDYPIVDALRLLDREKIRHLPVVKISGAGPTAAPPTVLAMVSPCASEP